MRVKTTLDCVLVGYSEGDLSESMEKAVKYSRHSGTYGYLRQNSVVWRGKRVSYADLLNGVLAQATGTNPHFHVANIPQLGCCYLKSYLERRGFTTEIVNFVNQERDRFAQLLDDSPLAVGISTTFYTDNTACSELTRYVRERSPATRVIIGGPHILNLRNDFTDESLEHFLHAIGADAYVVDAQGEQTLAQALSVLRANRDCDLSTVPNLILPRKGGFLHTERRPEHNDLNEDAIEWSRLPSDLIVPTSQVRTSRGCSFACAFCRYPVLGGRLELAEVETVRRELRTLHAMGVRHLIFVDDTFNVPIPRFKRLCRMMIKEGFGFRWYSYFRCASADDEALDLMQDAGCAGVFLGIESGDQTVLDNMNKAANVGRMLEGIHRLNKRDIITFACMVVGFPGETAKSVANTVRFINEAAPTYYRAELYFHDPKAPISSRSAEFGFKGRDFGWRHSSMQWQEALHHILEIYRDVKESTVLPIAGFDFWSLPYLMGQGLTCDQIRRFTAVAQESLLSGMTDDSWDAARHADRLVSVFQ